MEISCLTVTRGDLGRLARCLRAYVKQVWQDKQWVIVTDKSNGHVFQWVQSLGRKDIIAIPEEDGSGRWKLRNTAMDHATGDLVAQWDDDDLYHPELLWTQAKFLEMTELDACYLQTHMHYFESSGQMWVLDWGGIPDLGHPGTGMWRRTAEARYRPGTDTDHEHFPEDSFFQQDLQQSGRVGYIEDMPYLYGYTYHGDNTTGGVHHRKLVQTLAMTSAKIEGMLPGLKDRLAGLEIGTATLMGSDQRVCDLWGTGSRPKTT